MRDARWIAWRAGTRVVYHAVTFCKEVWLLHKLGILDGIRNAYNINSISNNKSREIYDWLQSAATTTASIHICSRPNCTEYSRVTWAPTAPGGKACAREREREQRKDRDTWKSSAFQWNIVALFACSFGLSTNSSSQHPGEAIDKQPCFKVILRKCSPFYELIHLYVSYVDSPGWCLRGDQRKTCTYFYWDVFLSLSPVILSPILHFISMLNCVSMLVFDE